MTYCNTRFSYFLGRFYTFYSAHQIRNDSTSTRRTRHKERAKRATSNDDFSLMAQRGTVGENNYPSECEESLATLEPIHRYSDLINSSG